MQLSKRLRHETSVGLVFLGWIKRSKRQDVKFGWYILFPQVADERGPGMSTSQRELSSVPKDSPVRRIRSILAVPTCEKLNQRSEGAADAMDATPPGRLRNTAGELRGSASGLKSIKTKIETQKKTHRYDPTANSQSSKQACTRPAMATKAKGTPGGKGFPVLRIQPKIRTATRTIIRSKITNGAEPNIPMYSANAR
jgi:hypothetical protein